MLCLLGRHPIVGKIILLSIPVANNSNIICYFQVGGSFDFFLNAMIFNTCILEGENTVVVNNFV